MLTDSLKLGIQAARAGEFEIAQTYFIEVVKSDPSSEKGWLYLGHCLKEPQKRQYCYQRVLKINPTNQDAKKALISLEKPGDQEAKIQTISAPRATVSKQDKNSKEPKRAFIFRSWLVGGIGLGLFLCLGAVLVLFGILQGQSIGLSNLLLIPSDISTPVAEVIFTSTPTVTPSATPTRTPRPTITLVATSTLMPSLTPYTGSLPITHWDQIIAADPENADAYYRRSDSRFYSTEAKGSISKYRDEIEKALFDIDTAIELSPEKGDYYSLRQRIYSQLLTTMDYTVDTQYIGTIALDNAYKAYELGTSLEDYPERIIVLNLIDSGRCSDSLKEVQKLMSVTPKTEVSYGGLLHIQSQAYACLGNMKDALASVDASMFNNVNIDYKKKLKARYLYELGRYDEALVLVNESISRYPEYHGFRYYLRAAIYYEKGMKELAKEDLYRGMSNTWSRGGFLLYVEAQFALD